MSCEWEGETIRIGKFIKKSLSFLWEGETIRIGKFIDEISKTTKLHNIGGTSLKRKGTADAMGSRSDEEADPPRLGLMLSPPPGHPEEPRAALPPRRRQPLRKPLLKRSRLSSGPDISEVADSDVGSDGGRRAVSPSDPSEGLDPGLNHAIVYIASKVRGMLDAALQGPREEIRRQGEVIAEQSKTIASLLARLDAIENERCTKGGDIQECQDLLSEAQAIDGLLRMPTLNAVGYSLTASLPRDAKSSLDALSHDETNAILPSPHTPPELLRAMKDNNEDCVTDDQQAADKVLNQREGGSHVSPGGCDASRGPSSRTVAVMTEAISEAATSPGKRRSATMTALNALMRVCFPKAE